MPTELRVPSRCRRTDRCARRERKDGEHVGALVELAGLCDRDHQLLVAALRDLPELHAQLHAVELLEPAATGVGGSGRGHGPASALPLQLGPLTLSQEIHDELTRWEDVVRDRTGMTPTDSARRSRLMPDRRVAPQHVDVARAAQLLRATVPVLLALIPQDMLRWAETGPRAGERFEFVREDGYAAAGRLIDLAGAARCAVGQTTQVEHLKGKACPGCGAQTLRLISADGKVRCTTCRDDWAEEEYDELAAILRGERRAPLEHRRRVWSSDDAPDRPVGAGVP